MAPHIHVSGLKLQTLCEANFVTRTPTVGVARTTPFRGFENLRHR